MAKSGNRSGRGQAGQTPINKIKVPIVQPTKTGERGQTVIPKVVPKEIK